MNKLLLLIPLIFCSCATIKKPEPPPETITARWTAYHRFQCKWGSQVACPATKRAKQGVTVAAHPDFDFGTKVKVHSEIFKEFVGSDELVVQDRGGAVRSKKASGGQEYVFDVYLEASNKQEANEKLRRFMREVPDYLEVEVF